MRKPTRNRTIALNENVAFGFAPRLSVSVWRKEVNVEDLRAFERELRAFVPECNGKGYASVTILEEGISARMTDDVRSTSEALQREFARHIRCMAYVVTHTGFVAAAARVVASGFALVTRAPYPMKILATPAETAAFVAKHIELEADEIERILSEARTAPPRPF